MLRLRRRLELLGKTLAPAGDSGRLVRWVFVSVSDGAVFAEHLMAY
jgi:hypothetical protein